VAPWTDSNRRPIFSGPLLSVRRLAVRHCCMTNISFPSAGTAVRPRWVLGLTSIAYFMVVLAARGHLGNPAAVTAGFRPALWSAVAFAVLAAATALAIPAPPRRKPAAQATAAADVPVAA
jgi:hypothetical protein